MNQPSPLYVTEPSLSLLNPWLRQYLPDLAPAVLRRFIQLVSGVFETRSLLIETIADSTAFRPTASSNAAQVRRILRDLRLIMEDLYYPFVCSILASVPATDLYLTVDETSHGTDYNVVQIWATDGMRLPLGMLIYAPNTPCYHLENLAEAHRFLQRGNDLARESAFAQLVEYAEYIATLEGMSEVIA